MNGKEKKKNEKKERNKQIIGGKTMKTLMRLITMTALLFIAVTNTLAQVNPVVSMQGFLTDSAGRALPDGEYQIIFRIYDDATAGTELWEESHIVVLDHGLYDAFLGSSQPLNIQLNRDLWLSVEVNEVLQPRLRLGSSFFSLKSLKSDSSAHALNSDFLGGKPASFYDPITSFSFESLSGTASDAQIPDDITISNAKNADSLAHKAVSEFLTDSELETHKNDADAHHIKYDDSNAIAAMGAKSDSNSLNHDKLSGIDFSSVTGTASDAQIPNDITINNAKNADSLAHIAAADFLTDSELETHKNDADAHHIKYDDSNAIVAMGLKSDSNPLNHDKTVSFSFGSLTGTATDAQIPNNITIENAENADSLGGAAAQSYALKSDLDFVPLPNYTFNLPSTQGGTGTVMANDGAGNLSWVTPSGGGGGEVVDGAFSTTSNVTSNSPGNLAVDDFVFGSTQLDDDLIGVHERRMFFDKSKGAFRAGFSNLGNWNEDNIGEFSAAFGRDTKASGNWSTAFGRDTEASGNWSIAMGNNLIANGNNSIAFGSAASTNNKNGAIVFGDASTTTNVIADNSNQFKVRAAGGVTFLTNSQMTTGVSLASGGGAWLTLSDSTMKRNIHLVNTEHILDMVMELPIKRWNYKSQREEIEHIGPMAQDFYSIFNVGENNVTISTIDPSGIALAAIQELYKSTKKLQSKTDEISELRRELQELREILNGMVTNNVR